MRVLPIISSLLIIKIIILGWFLHLGAGQIIVQDQQEEDQNSLSSSGSAMERQEQEALYSAIKGFVGDWWNGSDLYPDPCGWTPIQGVACDLYNGYWYVTSISIFGQVLDNSLRCNQTAAKFTPELFELRHLKSLSVISCFTSPILNPTQLPASKWDALSDSLESLEFRSNPGLVGTVPLAIGLLTRLESLVLVENGLAGNLPAELGSLVNLKRLVLAGNRFSGPIPDALGRLTELLILDSSRNALSGPIPSTFGGLASLLKLDLSSNKLEGSLPSEALGGLKNLTLLDIGSNNLSGGLVRFLQEMASSLEEFSASNNPGIGGDLMGIQWKNLQNLEVLDLSNTGLTGTIPESISEMTSLRYLGLSYNNLSGEIPSRLETMPNLGALYLYGNNFTGKLEFRPSFYVKMGRRFGAWNNSNLCYSVEMLPPSHVPNGVKPCLQGIKWR